MILTSFRSRRFHPLHVPVPARCVLVVLPLCTAAVSPAYATEPFARVGTYGATFAGMARGVRNLGMGATGTAEVGGLSTGYFNPASLAWADGITALGSYETWPADISLSDARFSSGFPFRADSAAAGPWRFGGSLGYARLGMDPQEERTIFLPEGTGRTFDAGDWLLSGTAAAGWEHGALEIGAGGTAKYLYSGLADDHVSWWAFDLGVVAAFPVDLSGARIRPRAGAAVLNLDTGASYHGREAFVATEKRAGLGFDVDSGPVLMAGRSVPALSFSVDADWIDREGYSPRDFSVGLEVSAARLFQVRYGASGDAYTTYGLGMGWDYGAWRFQLDYAHFSPEDGFLEFLEFDRDAFGLAVGVRW